MEAVHELRTQGLVAFTLFVAVAMLNSTNWLSRREAQLTVAVNSSPFLPFIKPWF